MEPSNDTTSTPDADTCSYSNTASVKLEDYVDLATDPHSFSACTTHAHLDSAYFPVYRHEHSSPAATPIDDNDDDSLTDYTPLDASDQDPDISDYVDLSDYVVPKLSFTARILATGSRLQLQPGPQHDVRANVSSTNDRSIHTRLRILPTLFPIYNTDGTSKPILCTRVGYFPLRFDDGHTHAVAISYSDQFAKTLLSPDWMCSRSTKEFAMFPSPHDLRNSTGILLLPRPNRLLLRLLLPRPNRLLIRLLNLHLNLHPNRRQRLHPNRLLLRLLLPRPNRLLLRLLLQLVHLPSHADGLPSKFTPHPFRSYDACDDAHADNQLCSKRSDDSAIQPHDRFHIDICFMHASSSTYTKTSTPTPRAVESHDGLKAYDISQTVRKYTWCFLCSFKTPPVDLVTTFLRDHDNASGPHRTARVDPGGELARSSDFRTAEAKAGHNTVPTGSDAPNQHSKVERLNRTFGVMVHNLLFASNLPPRFWSDALLHAVYKQYCHWHSALDLTPYEWYTGRRPNLRRLRAFGSRVTTKIPRTRPAKPDCHAFNRIFLSYTATDLYIRYWDLSSSRIKTARHAVFDETQLTSDRRHPGPQLLFDSVMTHNPSNLHQDVDGITRYTQWLDKWETERDHEAAAMQHEDGNANDQDLVKVKAFFVTPRDTGFTNVPIQVVGPANAPRNESVQATNNSRTVWCVNAGASTVDPALDYAGLQAEVTNKIENDWQWTDRSAQADSVSVNEVIRRTKMAGAPEHVDWIIATEAPDTPFDEREQLSDLIYATKVRCHLRATIIFIPMQEQEEPTDEQTDRHKKQTSRIADLINLAEHSLQCAVVFFKVRNTQQGRYIAATHWVVLMSASYLVIDEFEMSDKTVSGPQAIQECLDPTGLPIDDHLWPGDLYRLRFFDDEASESDTSRSRIALHFAANDDCEAKSIPVFDSSRPAPRLTNKSFRALNAPFAITVDDYCYGMAIRGIRHTELLSLYRFSPQETKDLATINQDLVNVRLQVQPPRQSVQAVAAELFLADNRAHDSAIEEREIDYGTWLDTLPQISVVTAYELNRWTTIPLPTQQQWKEETLVDHDLAILLQALRLTQILDKAALLDKRYHQEWRDNRLEEEEGIIYRYETQ